MRGGGGVLFFFTHPPPQPTKYILALIFSLADPQRCIWTSLSFGGKWGAAGRTATKSSRRPANCFIGVERGGGGTSLFRITLVFALLVRGGGGFQGLHFDLNMRLNFPINPRAGLGIPPHFYPNTHKLLNCLIGSRVGGGVDREFIGEGGFRV